MKNKGIVKKINERKITIEIYKDLNCSSCSSCNKKSHGTQTFFYDKRKIKTYSPLNRENFLLFRCLFSKDDT